MNDVDTDKLSNAQADANPNTSQHNITLNWHPDAHYVPPTGGSQIISLKAQLQSLQAVINIRKNNLPIESYIAFCSSL
jgi:hypothetical protein